MLSLFDQKQKKNVNVVGELNDQLFHAIQNFVPHLKINFFDGDWKWIMVRSGCFEKWVPSGTMLKIRKTNEEQIIKLTGVEDKGEFLTSAEEGIIKIESTGTFWLAEYLL